MAAVEAEAAGVHESMDGAALEVGVDEDDEDIIVAHLAKDNQSPALVAASASSLSSSAVVDLESEGGRSTWPKQLTLVCKVSQSRLEDPAKGLSCEHLAYCNYEALKLAVQRTSGLPGACIVCQASLTLTLTLTIAPTLTRSPVICHARKAMPNYWLQGTLVVHALHQARRDAQA